MDTTSECKCSGSCTKFSSRISLSKQESVRKYKQDLEAKLSDAYLTLLFTKVDSFDKPVSAQEHIPHNDDDFEYEYDAT